MLAIGIVVDDAIVIVEGVTKYIERGMSGHDAAIAAMDELFGPIIGITLVLMAVFIPAAFVPGLTGNMFAQFALVIAATAFISAINAATLKPTQCALWLRTPVPPEKRNFLFRLFNHVYDPTERGYTGLIGRMVKHSGLMVILALIVSGLGFWGLTRIPTAFIPIDDQGYLMLAVQLPEGASLGRTTDIAQMGDQGRARHPGRRSGHHRLRPFGARQQRRPLQRRRRLGDAEAVRGAAEGQGPGSPLDLQPPARRRSPSMPDGRPFVLPPPAIQGIGNAGGFQMQLELLGGSTDYQKLGNLTDQIVARRPPIRASPSVLTTFRTNAPEVTLLVDRDRAQTLRVSVGDIFSTLTDYVGSTYVNQFNKFGQSLQVYVQADSKYRLHPEDLLNLYVRSQDGKMVPIGAVAHLGQTVVAAADDALQSLSRPRPSSARPARGYSSGQAMDGDGGDRQARPARRRLLRMDGDVLSGEDHRQPALLRVRPVAAARLSRARGPVRELDPAARGARARCRSRCSGR